jgi:hypothetical protein
MAGGEAVGAEIAGEASRSVNFTPWLQEMQGIGVRPRAYSSAKRSITLVRKRLS